MKKQKKSSKLNYYFFFAVAIVYIVTALVAPATAWDALGIFLNIFIQIAPVLVIVFFLLFLTDLIIKPEKVMKYLGKDSGLIGWPVAIAGGIISSGPIFVWFPFLADLREKGMRTAFASTFLYNRAVKVPLLPLMIYYFGIAFTAVLTVYMIVFSIVIGILTEWIAGPENEK